MAESDGEGARLYPSFRSPRRRACACVLAAALGALPGSSAAALLALVLAGASETAHTYDVVLDTQGSRVVSLDAVFETVEVACPGCFALASVSPHPDDPLGVFVVAFPSGPGLSWHAGSADGEGPFDGVALATLRVDHAPLSTFGAGALELRIGPDPPSGFVGPAGPLSSTCGAPPTPGCVLAVLAPEPAPLLPVAAGLAWLSRRARRARGRAASGVGRGGVLPDVHGIQVLHSERHSVLTRRGVLDHSTSDRATL